MRFILVFLKKVLHSNMCDAFPLLEHLADSAIQPYWQARSPNVLRSMQIFQELNHSKLRIYQVHPWKGISFLRCDTNSRLIGRFRPGEGGNQGKQVGMHTNMMKALASDEKRLCLRIGRRTIPVVFSFNDFPTIPTPTAVFCTPKPLVRMLKSLR